MLDNLPRIPSASQKTRHGRLPSGLDANILAHLAGQKRRLLILAADAQEALRLHAEVQFFDPSLCVLLFPDWQTLPYDHFSPHSELVSERLASLWHICQREYDIIITPVSTPMTRLAPIRHFLRHTFFLQNKQRLDIVQLRENLINAGYHHVTQVMAQGEFSIRGGLIDMFPMGAPLPYRIDLFDDEIDSLRTFDPETQRTLYAVHEIRMLPAREYPMDAGGIAAFRQRYRARIDGDLSTSRIYKEVSKGLWPGGIEYFMPLFFDETATLFDYLGDDVVIVLHHDVERAATIFWKEVESRYGMACGDVERPVLPPADIFLRPDELMACLKPYARIELAGDGDLVEGCAILPDLSVERSADQPLHKLHSFIRGGQQRILITVESLGRRETVHQFLQENGIRPYQVESWAEFILGDMELAISVAPLFSGFSMLFEGMAVITEAELYQNMVRSHIRRKRARASSDSMLRDLAEVKAGDPVVHEQHGIARYIGLVSMDLGEGKTELMQLEYAEGATLYVPVSQLHLISRYAGGALDQVHLSTLGHPAWEKAKKRAVLKAYDTAAELLNLYAQRTARKGYAFRFPAADYASFSTAFSFEETPDQASAIEAVVQDMCSAKPMDRLICGDVGFGKTEVALRAAFIAVFGGKQVAVLVPTTLLAEQHLQSFSDRFADWPVKIAELSRFCSTKESKSVKDGLAAGCIDIVIGTHKLVEPEIEFKNLGLVIIDEEHRFGVRQKEQLKKLRANVDVLTLTATPIPRTLWMALEGLRDCSIIATPPIRRLPVKTFVSRMNHGVIREAVLRELKRGGQVFFLHNEVSTIENMRDKLVELVPEARIGVAHGKLRERELEQVMRDFLQKRFNVLLCSTIIETGIDIPNANTILINRADKFGLAQLHQLRGRVGRSHHQAYAYLLTPEGITKDSMRRLEAIQMSDELGAGFYLAMRDLEIRGAGEVLGDGQSGEVESIGFSLFTEILKQAVRNLTKGCEPDLAAPLGITTEVNMHSPALLPDAYCPDVHERLMLYKRLASCESEQEVDDIHEELIDRFGLPPQPVKTLIDSHHLRLQAKALGVKKLDASEGLVQVCFAEKPQIDPIKIIQLLQEKRNYRMAGQGTLRVEVSTQNVAHRVVRVRELLKELSLYRTNTRQ